MQNGLCFTVNALALGVLCSLVACAIDLAAPGSSGGAGGHAGEAPIAAGGDRGDGGAGGALPSCDVCATLPAGFSGFVRLATNDAPCTGESPVVWRGGFVAGEVAFDFEPAVCTCSCVGTCPSVLGAVSSGGQQQCSDSGGIDVLLFPDSCVQVPQARNLKIQLPPSAPACASDAAAPLRPSVAFAQPVEVCTAKLDPCGEQAVCLPAEGKYCIYAEGEESCPDGYSDRSTVIREQDLTDSRDCSCDCDPGDPICANPGSFSLFDQPDCSAELSSDVVSATCIRADNGEFSAVLYEPMTELGCSVATFQSGEVSSRGTGVTFCCR